MPYVTLPGGIVAHVKMAKSPRRRCSAKTECGLRCSNFGTFQCDYPVWPSKTCDAHVCRAHAIDVGPDVHHCPTHATAQQGLFTSLVT